MHLDLTLGVWKLSGEKIRKVEKGSISSPFLEYLKSDFDFLSEKRTRIPTFLGVAYEGWLLHAIFRVGADILKLIGFERISKVSKYFSYFCLAFFRNFERRVYGVSGDGRILLSPADGKVIGVDEVEDKWLGKARRVKIFMSPFDYHMNRAPANMVLEDYAYRTGSFSMAFDKDADNNERLESLWRLESGEKIKIVQIAGWLARRIDFRVEKRDRVAVGEVFGMIKFSSRVDLYAPYEFVPTVKEGMRVVAGVTTLFRKV